MKVYSPNEIADLLKVKAGTLRKYSVLLENAGYTFQKNSRKQRYYSDEDIITLQKLMTLKDSGMTLEESVQGVVLWHKGNEPDNVSVAPYQPDTNNVTQHDNSDINELKDMMYKQNELIGELSKRLDEQQNYIDKRLNKHDEILMQSMNESLEARKQIATAKENKSFWSKLFKKWIIVSF